MLMLSRMALDHSTQHSAFRLGHILAMKYVNARSGEAWPTRETLARDLNVSVRTIQTLITELRDNGWIFVTGTRGRNKPNRYRLNLENGKPVSHFDRRKQEVSFRVIEGKIGSGVPENRKFDCKKTGSRLPAEPYEEHYEEPVRSRGSLGDAIASPDRPVATTIRRYMKPDAIPTEEDTRHALEECGMTQEQFERQWSKFVDWNIARGAAATDWGANWRSWCDRYPEIQDNVLRLRRHA